MSVSQQEAGIVTNTQGEIVILLPMGPISRKVEGSSGHDHEEVLVDDPDLGRPVGRIQPAGETVYKHPYE